jgi:hypothetical protein
MPAFLIESETLKLKYIFEVMISGAPLPEAFQEHRLDKRGKNALLRKLDLLD